ncbi:low molecular weight protein-tyrosine-phosphatase [Sphingomonas montanisoli]|uniref:protein-tyrosine-phosphatase n=1 Tax=Sphingomonas montanisoli TaxID=2606412 RepID=A0A5D9CDY2_9SPHN|nr:low molecular weight protein-tyrosine-phosphatase [Sphingomonas montanisoli]TZG29547.1 low molecular weight phosphotyrosine protein phosphatase [Sphingomonas montanisoli]
MSKHSILFVCLGNICRSPLAEAAFRARAQAAGIDVTIDSAGTGDWHIGRPPDDRAQAVAQTNGIDISGYRGRQIAPADFRNFSHIFALDAQNLADLARVAPADGTAEVALLLDLVGGMEGKSVADPYFGDDDGFDTTWDQVDRAAQALVDRLSA